ncbi:isochorismate synthase [Microbacterium mangrovi]|uniref:Isochorismate synthase n=1 Tax=Microbacterium mangrovi TaxID=1348253 RepID=A0A0B2A8Z1_9MICO|nr:chorismate-binding protein [Microbacterium mangrovi]KHK98007.1 isochorismate synthase [Microbacterium mangrovi]
MTSSVRPHLIATTREIDPSNAAEPADLLPFTDPDQPLAWLRRGDGIVGVGGAVERVTFPGATDAADAWRCLTDGAVVDDPVGLPGTGLVAFGAFAFDVPSAWPSTLIVPRAVVGRHGSRAWVTRVRRSDEPDAADEPASLPEPLPYGPYWPATVGPGVQGPEGYQESVRAGLEAIAAGRVSKVVLARDLVGSVPAGADLRRLARALDTEYPDTWMYAVDGLIGASPETLVTVDSGTVTARVLAGTAARGADPDEDAAAEAALAASRKDTEEHVFAVRSVVDVLRPHTTGLTAPAMFTLQLPNVWHLATDIAGDLSDTASALDLVAALHPTAAVAGTPTDAARALIRELEPFDRGRYAGPVGWVDAAGNGEWAIALRGAQFGTPGEVVPAPGTPIPVVAHAGAGIVAASDPEAEMLETRVKFRPIVDALA